MWTTKSKYGYYRISLWAFLHNTMKYRVVENDADEKKNVKNKAVVKNRMIEKKPSIEKYLI